MTRTRGSTAGVTSSRSRTHSNEQTLDERLWIPHYLPHWSSREASAARYEVGGGLLRLKIEADQAPWNPDVDGELRVSSLQTGVFAGPVGSDIGQHRFKRGLTVREAQESVALYTPRYGLFELRARALDDPAAMVALWMIGYEDVPTRSAEICVCEIFGRDVGPDTARIGMGLHPFGDPSITDAFSAESVRIDVRQVHTYSVVWAPDSRCLLHRRSADQGRSPIAVVSDAVHARHLRIQGPPGRARGPRALSEGLRGRGLPRLSASGFASTGAPADGWSWPLDGLIGGPRAITER